MAIDNEYFPRVNYDEPLNDQVDQDCDCAFEQRMWYYRMLILYRQKPSLTTWIISWIFYHNQHIPAIIKNLFCYVYH